MFLTQLDYPAYLLFAITSDDNLWNLAIETGIRSPSKGTKLSYTCIIFGKYTKKLSYLFFLILYFFHYYIFFRKFATILNIIITKNPLLCQH